ncbi:MAG: S4 domain-containing protein, partial [Candidatus Omnitrophica bacterium]|nr:S4 domain-containing protein [Candidatus Omnitrophota bacterium]
KAMFVFTRAQARQFIKHGFVFVNNRRVDIPSFLVKASDIIEIRAKDNFKKMISEINETDSKFRSVPDWLQIDKEKLTIKVSRLPTKEDLTIPINEQLIVELYSK